MTLMPHDLQELAAISVVVVAVLFLIYWLVFKGGC